MQDHNEFFAEISAFASGLLEAYVSRLEVRSPRLPKELNDPVWQTIVLTPIEIIVLDSPLLQRLRGIRQLGVVHWVYPGATHSRLEHSIGAVHQVQRVISSINAHARKQASVVGEDLVALLRLTALCHDIGHGAMSHVSEKAMGYFADLERVRNAFVDVTRAEKPSFSEIAAYGMIGSVHFRRLVERAQELSGQSLPRDAVELMRNAIIGQPIDDRTPLLHELINGPFDADKLDYMTRDAQMSGVPVVTDVPRLVQKVRAVEVERDRLPETVAKTVSSHPSYWLTGIALAGGRTLDELMLGRALLFDKLYRHHKVRAAEVMIAALYQQLSRLLSAPPLLLPYIFPDSDLIALTEARLREAEEDIDAAHKVHLEVALDLSRRLRERRLFVRAFAFAQHPPRDPYRGEREQGASLEHLMRDVSDWERRGKLVRSISGEIRAILECLDEKDMLEEWEEPRLESYVWIDPPDAPAKVNDINRALIVTNEGDVIPFREEAAESRAWADAYLLARDLGYVFTTRTLAPFVFVATKKVLRLEYGIRVPRSFSLYSRQSASDLRKLEQRLAAAGYFAGVPFDLRPMPPRLEKADVPRRLRILVGQLAGYSGPESELGGENAEPGLVNEERVVNWLRQFDDNELVEVGLEVATKVRLIGRDEIVRGVNAFLEHNEEYQQAFICPLGEPKDSSAICTYLAGDVAARFPIDLSSLPEALNSGDGRPIIFLDDFISSGRQSVVIVESLLGLDPSFDLGEKRAALAEELRELLKKRQLGFIFAAGMSEGKERLSGRLKDIFGRAHPIAIGVGEEHLPRAFAEEPRSEEEERFRSRCREIGAQLLKDDDPRHTPEWIAKRALGYGNHGLLVVLPFNTPTQTLTCLWKGGMLDGIPWDPLFPRRKKI